MFFNKIYSYIRAICVIGRRTRETLISPLHHITKKLQKYPLK